MYKELVFKDFDFCRLHVCLISDNSKVVLCYMLSRADFFTYKLCIYCVNNHKVLYFLLQSPHRIILFETIQNRTELKQILDHS
jgi:hypothetical protein